MTTVTPATGEHQARLKDYALHYAALGWEVFPCIAHAGRKEKQPYSDVRLGLEHGHKDASSDLEKVAAWWDKWPKALIALRVPDHCVVIDVDPRNGGTLDELKKWCGGKVPDTLTSASGREDGGRHFWFVTPHELNTKGKLATGIDVKKCGKGYIIAPPSPHPATGKPYRWVNLSPAGLLPAKIQEHLLAAPSRPRRESPTSVATMLAASSSLTTVLAPAGGNHAAIVSDTAAAPEGERNSTLFRSACFFARDEEKGVKPDWNALMSAARGTGLNELEIEKTIQSARQSVREGGAAWEFSPLN